MSLSAATQQQSRSDVLSKAVLNAAEILGISNSRLAKILGVSPSTITRLGGGAYRLAEGKKEWEFGVLLVRLFRSLDSISGGSDEVAQQWMKSENRAFAGRKPLELVETTEGLVRVVSYLDAIRGLV
ncbi:MAG TPA: DUF2384 domain-containing protein [Chlorobaculum parvum]|uniref:DUF2384 domain-containing protein n=1 Tax=Chlorobaculum parvum TaxID=274539 RepID=A0A7C5DK86_9CHLB|nr:DUF2384 domain-containing protein [Chlorobaculum parvum]